MMSLHAVPSPSCAPAAPTDDDLMLLVAANDRRAFRLLVERHELRVRRYVARMVGPAEADDIAQEVFLRLFDQRGRYVGTGRFLPFLFRVARNRALNHTRWRRLRVMWNSDEHKERAERDSAVDAQPTAEHLAFLVDQERNHIVQGWVLKMKPSLREVFVLRFVEELDYEAIAAIVGISEDNARARAHRALSWLRDKAKNLEGS